MIPQRLARIVTALAATAVTVATLAGCRREEQPSASAEAAAAANRGRPRHLVLVTIDTLRADHLSLHGYRRATSPELDALAARGVVFERAIAQWPKTGPSFASMFTGRYPQTTGLTHKAALTLPDSYLVLPELLEAQGFTTFAVVSNGVLARDLGWPQGFGEYKETWNGSWPSDDPAEYRKLMWAGRVNELALPLFGQHRDAERIFAWIHYSDPHAPYLLVGGATNPFLGDRFAADRQLVDLRGTKGRAIGEERELGYYVAQYDANIRVASAHVGALVAELERLGLFEETLLIVTADHGESLGVHGVYFEHGPPPYNTTVHVPLIVIAPGRLAAGRRVPAPGELLDLYPTVREWLAPEVAVPGLEGKSLLPWLVGAPLAGAPAHYAFSEAGASGRHLRAVQDEAWKIVFRPTRAEPPPAAREPAGHFELFELGSDPLETTSLAQHEPVQLARLREVLFDWLEAPALAAPEDELSDSTARALRALGYVE